MKKIIKTFTLIGVFTFANLLHATDQETANNIGHALSSISIALNNLSQTDYCLLKTTVENTSLTNEQKSTILNADPEISHFLQVVETNGTIISNNNGQTFISDPIKKELVVDVVTSDFDSRPNVNDCNVYNAGRRACNSEFIACSTLGYYGCLGLGPLYPICAASVFVACTANMVTCHDLNAASHPNCGGAGGIVVTWNSWLNNNNPSHNCSE